jgi:hypothetical protein
VWCEGSRSWKRWQKAYSNALLAHFAAPFSHRPKQTEMVGAQCKLEIDCVPELTQLFFNSRSSTAAVAFVVQRAFVIR